MLKKFRLKDKMAQPNGRNCEHKMKEHLIPKHLYDVQKLFPNGVGKCCKTNGPNNKLSKVTQDWLSKVAFKMCVLL